MFCKHPSGYCPNGCELNCMGEEPTTKGVVVSAWEGSKFQEAVEDEKKYGRKRPDPDLAKGLQSGLPPPPPRPKYDVGDYLAYNAASGERVCKVASISVRKIQKGGGWYVYYRLGGKDLVEKDVTRRLVEAP